MRTQLAVAALLMLIGVSFMVTGTPLCENDCWLEQVCDRVLPDALDAFSGGLPWVIVGFVLAVHTLCMQHRQSKRPGKP